MSKRENVTDAIYTSTPVTNPSRMTSNSLRDGSRKGEGGVLRARSLTRPDRQRPRPPLFNHDIPPPPPPKKHSRADMVRARNEILNASAVHKEMNNVIPSDEAKQHPQSAPQTPARAGNMTWWSITANVATCCFPGWFLGYCLNKRNPLVRQAWREKVIPLDTCLF